ncbi:DUF1127 domain-containing protein [Yoonia sp.]|uniref:DUF1127 domain-containing protein n=1 Tax=Yoonia sp. TaxID=2212373 RepID=UPI00358E69E3
MAFYTDTIESRTAPKASSALTFMSGAFRRIIAAQNRSADVDRMQALDDSELADMGLSRDAIVRHVYRDIYYI